MNANTKGAQSISPGRRVPGVTKQCFRKNTIVHLRQKLATPYRSVEEQLEHPYFSRCTPHRYMEKPCQEEPEPCAQDAAASMLPITGT